MNSTKKSNIVLIGMPGSGKSTVGKRLADSLNLAFIDTDRLIEQNENLPLQKVVDRFGLNYLMQKEQEVLLDLEVEDSVIATGGSAIYSVSAMRHLGKRGHLVYLKISLLSLLRRVGSGGTRGLMKLPRMSLPQLYLERLQLYTEWADLEIENNYDLSAFHYDRILSQVRAAFDG